MQGPQAITVPEVKDTPLSAGSLTLGATATSGWTVQYSTDTPHGAGSGKGGR